MSRKSGGKQEKNQTIVEFEPLQLRALNELARTKLKAWLLAACVHTHIYGHQLTYPL